MLSITLTVGTTSRRHPLGTSVHRIGSGPGNDVRVSSPYVSEHHLSLSAEAGLIHVEDAGSRNGTWLGARRIVREALAPPFELTLGPGTALRVEDVPTDEVVLSPAVGATGRPHAAASAHTTAPAAESQPAGIHAAPAMLRALAAARAPASPVHALLEALRESTGARCVALLRIAADGPPEVITCAGLAGDDALAAIPAPGQVGPRFGSGWANVPVGQEAALVLCGAVAVPLDLAAAADAVVLATALEPRAPHASLATARRAGFALQLGDGGSVVEGRSSVIRELHRRMAGALTSDLPVLLTGSTGVGKEVYARSLHLGSPRASRPFQAVNAAAIPEALLESLLFGVEEGAATGVRRQPGLLRRCEGGTFFLDEAAEMTPGLQVKLLRALDQRQVLPVGASAPIAIDVRIVAATNRDLTREIAEGRFRLDLYHRLRGHEFRIPDLRERAEDVPELVSAFLREACEQVGRHVPGVTLRAMRMLQEHDWPGNVRELSTTIRRIVHELDDDRAITHEDLPAAVRAGAAKSVAAAGPTIEDQLDVVRRRILAEALDAAQGNRSVAATRLGLSRGGLRALLRRLGLDDG